MIRRSVGPGPATLSCGAAGAGVDGAGPPGVGSDPVDIDRFVGEFAVAGRATATRRECGQIFEGLHPLLQAPKVAGIEAAFGVNLVCPGR
jgi:integrase/recombinase XerD